LATIPLSFWESKISFLIKMVKTRRRPPESMRNTKTPRMMVKRRGREE
jgi:hypothetical protein